MKILVVSHGGFSEELIKTAEMIIGESNITSFLRLESSDSVDHFYERVLEKLDDAQDDVLIFSDLLGGSPMLSALRVLSNEEPYKRAIITGMNLPMLVEVVTQIGMGNDDFYKIVSIAETTGREGIKTFMKKEGQ